MRIHSAGRPVNLTYPRSVDRVQVNVEIPVSLKRAVFERSVANDRTQRDEVQAALESWVTV